MSSVGGRRTPSGHLIPEEIDYDKDPEVSRSLVRLLNFLTIVGTAVREHDVFRRNKNGSFNNKRNSRRPSLLQALKRGSSGSMREESKEENSDDEDGIDLADTDPQTTEEELAELERLKEKGFLTEAEYEDAKDLIMIQALDIPDEESEDGDDEMNYGKMLADEGTFDERLQVTAAQYLIGVFILDSLGWAVGKMALLEVLFLADELGYSIVYISLILASTEATIEFFSSSIVPTLYSFMHNTDAISSRGLVEFAVNAYYYSALCALIAYPILGILTQGYGISSPSMFIAFAVVQSFQYPLINQLGDQAVEMALPHWLATFDKLVLVSPGVQLIDKCKIHKACKICCAICGCGPMDCLFAICCWPCWCLRKTWYCLFVNEKKVEMDEEDEFEENIRQRRRRSHMNMRNEMATVMNDEIMGSVPTGSKSDASKYNPRMKSHSEWRSKWRNNLASRANSDSLAYFLNLSRFILSAIFTFIYIACDRLGSASIRWFALMFFCVLSYYSSSTMRRGFRYVKRGIKHEVVEQNHAPTPWLWEMTGAEVSLVIFSTVIFTVPSDGAAAALAVLYVTLSSSISVIVIVFGGIAVLVYLIKKISTINELADEDVKRMREENNTGSFLGSFKSAKPEPSNEATAKQQQSTSSSYFARYWTKTPEQLAAIEAKKQARLDKKADAEHYLTTFAIWLKYYMAIVVMISLSAICLYTSASFFYEASPLVNEDIVYNTTTCYNTTNTTVTTVMNSTTGANVNATLNATVVKCDIEFYTEKAEESSTNLGGIALFVMSALLLVPYFAINADLKSRFESVMFHYSEGQASGIVYYRNVFTVVLKLPVLIVNWYVLQASDLSGDDDGVLTRKDDDYDDGSYEMQLAEEKEDRYDQRVGGIVLGVSVGVLLVALVYYMLVDPRLNDNHSATKLVNRTGKKIAQAANITAAARIMADKLARQRAEAMEQEEAENGMLMQVQSSPATKKSSFKASSSSLSSSVQSSKTSSTTYNRHAPRSSSTNNPTFDIKGSIGGEL